MPTIAQIVPPPLFCAHLHTLYIQFCFLLSQPLKYPSNLLGYFDPLNVKTIFLIYS